MANQLAIILVTCLLMFMVEAKLAPRENGKRFQYDFGGPNKLSGIYVEGSTRMMFEGEGFGTSAKMYYDTVLKQAFARGLRTHANDLPVTCKQSILLGRYLLSEYNGYFYSKSQNLARELCKAYDRALQNYDVLLMPTVPRKAQALPLANMSLTEYTEKSFSHSINTSSTAVTGHPAMSINVGFSSGLPVGMMIIGKKFQEATLLNVAFAYENIRDSVNL